jgi:hypothetical protein
MCPDPADVEYPFVIFFPSQVGVQTVQVESCPIMMTMMTSTIRRAASTLRSSDGGAADRHLEERLTRR